MAKLRLLQWMRDQLSSHAERVVLPAAEKKALEAAYKKAAPLVASVVTKKFPPADMKVLARWKSAVPCRTPKLQFPNGTVTEFKFDDDDAPLRPDEYTYSGQIYLADTSTAAAVEKWEAAHDTYTAERKKRLTAYKALIDGASNVEDIVALWPEAASILPAGSLPIPLGPEQIALVKADLRERKAA